MVQPENVNPRNFQVQQVLYNDGDFSIAWGKWQGGNMRMAMRWNGEGDDPGYPSAFKNPIWFLVSDKLDIQIFRALFGAESVDINAIMAAIGGLSEISSKKVASFVADVDAIKNSIGNHTTPIINIGNLIGKMLLIDDGLVIPITITPTSQDVFEQDLKVLLEIVKNYSIPVTLKFKTGAGGGLVLPDWFIDACKQLGIAFEFVNESKDSCVTCNFIKKKERKMKTWWLALDRDCTSYQEVKHRKIIAQGWRSLGDLVTLKPLVQNNNNWELFEQVIQELARGAYGNGSHEINRAPSVMWNLLKIEANDLIVGIEGTAVKGICQINQNGWSSYKYDGSGAYEYAQTVGFPVEWFDWDISIYGPAPNPPAQAVLGIKGLNNDSERVINAWKAIHP